MCDHLPTFLSSGCDRLQTFILSVCDHLPTFLSFGCGHLQTFILSVCDHLPTFLSFGCGHFSKIFALITLCFYLDGPVLEKYGQCQTGIGMNIFPEV